jgi:hypothetical protein
VTARGGPPGAPAGRVAVIAVHGVADQQPGTTSRALVDLLVASPPKGVAYTAIATEDLCIAVNPLAPGKGAPPLRDDATPLAEERPARKALLQSFRCTRDRLVAFRRSQSMSSSFAELDARRKRNYALNLSIVPTPAYAARRKYSVGVLPPRPLAKRVCGASVLR